VTTDTVSLVAASFFLLIAVVGGGFTAKELVIPEVPGWARIVSALLGVVFATPFIMKAFDNPTPQADRPASNEGSSEESNVGEVILHSVKPRHAISSQGLRLVSLRATAPRKPPRVRDRITIRYTLANVGEKRFRLISTFVGARDAVKTNKDSDGSNTDVELRPNETLQAKEYIIADTSGRWKMWPCYAFKKNNEEAYCPDEWNAFLVEVGG
jgi:hypothetical protein